MQHQQRAVHCSRLSVQLWFGLAPPLLAAFTHSPTGVGEKEEVEEMREKEEEMVSGLVDDFEEVCEEVLPGCS